MNSEEIEARSVNSGLIYIPTRAQWEVLLREPVVDGHPIGAIDLAQGNLRFSQEHSVIRSCIHRPSPFLGWLPITLLETPTLLQRVQIENSRCPRCHWQGVVATPAVLALYFGTANPQAEYQASFQLLTVTCPKCGSNLTGHPIWFANT